MTGHSRLRDGSQRWLITFADLAAVLLAFFVMMFAMAEIDTDRWEGAVDALSRRLYLQNEEVLSSRPQAERNVPVVRLKQGQSLSYLAALLQQQVEKAGAAEGVDVDLQDDRLVLSLLNEAVFETTGTRLRPEGRRLAFELSGVLAGVRNQVAVVSYARAAHEELAQDALLRAVALGQALRVGGLGRSVTPLVRATGFTDARRIREIEIVLLDARVSE